MNSRRARAYTGPAVIIAAFCCIIPELFAETPVRISIPGSAFVVEGRGARNEVVGSGRAFHGKPGDPDTILRTTVRVPPVTSAKHQMLRLSVRLQSDIPYISSVEIKNGSKSELRVSTRLEARRMEEKVVFNATAKPLIVDSQSVIILTISFGGGGIDGGVPASASLLLDSVIAEFPATIPFAVGRLSQPPVASNSVIYALSNNNELQWNSHSGRNDGSMAWSSQAAKNVGRGWDFKQIFPGDDGVIYAITSSGDLMWYRHDGRLTGAFEWTDPRKVDSGWNYDHVFSGGGGVIYAVTTSGDLLWFRHDGRRDGTPRWAFKQGKTVGTGWVCKQVFAGGNGVIYAVMPNNDLKWYRHDGRPDGSPTWAYNGGGRKVAENWDYKRVFSSGDGVIYALTSSNELLWFRHLGRDDGSDKWTNMKGTRVGLEWAVKDVFSGATLAP